MAATETITSIILIKLIRVSLGTVRHPRRFKIVVIDIQITLKQMLRDFIGIRVNRAKKSGMVNRSEERFSRNAETDLVCRLLLEVTIGILHAFPTRRSSDLDGSNGNHNEHHLD